MSVTNTTKATKRDPLANQLAEAMMIGSSNAIERQEANGQRELVNSSVLPSRGIGEIEPILKAAGGSVGQAVEGDSIFVNVILPEGWSKRATDHSMWSDLIDEKGRKRAGIFYKAAFYDRSAHISANRRFAIDDGYSHEPKNEIKCSVSDQCGEVVFSVSELVGENEKEYNVRDRVTEKIKQWLDANYPLWTDPTQYWN